MSDFWSGVFTGIGTSGAVAAVVYWIQRRDSGRSESKLTNKLAANAAVARENLRTTLVIQETANEIHKAVLDAQHASSLNPAKETMLPSHQAAAQEFLDRVDLDGLKALHTAIAGKHIIYAGLVRDAEVLVSGSSSPALIPAPADEVQASLQRWLSRTDALLESGNIDPREAIEKISELHTELMRIHPFFDGNGLLGRAIIFALHKRLLGSGCVVPRDDAEYFTCLRSALSGKKEPLVEYLRQRSAA